MGNICCLLDACTVINLIHIDDEDFLLKKIKLLDIHINDTVFTEIKLNVYDRLSNNISKYSDEEEKKLVRKDIDQKISFFRGKKNNNDELFKELGDGFFEKVQQITGYTKRSNGELCSTAYAMYLSRLNQKKVFFYTDDFPAKEFFTHFFEFQQIGHIKDSVDFLILIYWLNDEFTDLQLDRLLSELYSQYATEVIILREHLQRFYNEKVDAQFLKNSSNTLPKLRMLITSLNNFDFKNIKNYWDYFENNKSKCKEIFNIIKRHNSVYEMGNNPNSETLLNKIIRTRSLIKKQKIYKWDDLMAN